jgi:hypothetical protein
MFYMWEGNLLSRKKKFRRKKYINRIKTAIAIVFAVSVIGTSMSVTFADQDVTAKLTSWFEKKKNESLSQIEQAIMDERESQKERLRIELTKVINQADSELDQYTEKEKEKRVQAIRNHADSLINDLTIDNSKNREKITNELNIIIENAIEEMNKVGKSVAEPQPTAVDDKKGKESSSDVPVKDTDGKAAKSNSSSPEKIDKKIVSEEESIAAPIKEDVSKEGDSLQKGDKGE